jgi:pimeloyl-ACP methyl ester carboxylesterase
MTRSATATDEGFAPIGDLQMYWRSLGSGGTPLVVVHGGFGTADTWGDLLDRLAERRRVVAVELQGHGRTADIDRPFGFEAFGDDLAGLVEHLGLGPADLLGYSVGGGAALRAALQHPGLLRRLVLVGTPCRRAAWYPEVTAGMDQIGSGGFPMMRQTPLYAAYAAVAPDPEAFPRLMDRTGELLRRPYDWTEEVRGLTVPTLLVCGDADSFPPVAAAEFFALLGGGQRDGVWDGSGRPASSLAVLPGRTHYDLTAAPELPDVVAGFLDRP